MHVEGSSSYDSVLEFLILSNFSFSRFSVLSVGAAKEARTLEVCSIPLRAK